MSETLAIDSSAVLALLYREAGAQVVTEAVEGEARLLMSTVNLGEVVARLVDAGYTDGDLFGAIDGLPVETPEFTRELAMAAGLLRSSTRHLGLSGGDRACLAFAMSESIPVLTADRSWASLDIGVEIRLIR